MAQFQLRAGVTWEAALREGKEFILSYVLPQLEGRCYPVASTGKKTWHPKSYTN